MFLRTIALLASVGAVASVGAQYDPSVAWSALHYCKSAYCQNSAISSWSCGSSCAFHPNFQVYGVYTPASIDSQAFTGYDPTAGNIVVAFRGSANIPNWINDLDFIKTTYPNPACNCEVHQGFLGEWQSLQADVLHDVSAMLTQYGNVPVLVTGHSLGAAVSILAAMDIINQVTSSVTVYNFGEPRVGDPTFAAWAASQLQAGKQYRVTHARDPVPHVPMKVLGFLHAPHELWYDNDGNSQYYDCQDSPTAEDPNCSDSVVPYGIDDHLLYLGICTECSCSSEYLTAKYGPQKAKLILDHMAHPRNGTLSKRTRFVRKHQP